MNPQRANRPPAPLLWGRCALAVPALRRSRPAIEWQQGTSPHAPLMTQLRGPVDLDRLSPACGPFFEVMR